MAYLVKVAGNYANEFDVQGFNVYDSKEEVDTLQESLAFMQKYFPYEELYFGTNEFVTGDCLNYEITEISDEQAQMIKTLFNLHGYGYGMFFDVTEHMIDNLSLMDYADPAKYNANLFDYQVYNRFFGKENEEIELPWYRDFWFQYSDCWQVDKYARKEIKDHQSSITEVSKMMDEELMAVRKMYAKDAYAFLVRHGVKVRKYDPEVESFFVEVNAFEVFKDYLD